jgi:hypothetical protein
LPLPGHGEQEAVSRRAVNVPPISTPHSCGRLSTLGERDKLIYAPMADIGGVLYDQDAVYIHLKPNQISFSAPDTLVGCVSAVIGCCLSSQRPRAGAARTTPTTQRRPRPRPSSSLRVSSAEWGSLGRRGHPWPCEQSSCATARESRWCGRCRAWLCRWIRSESAAPRRRAKTDETDRQRARSGAWL